MAKSIIEPGICNLTTEVTVNKINKKKATIQITSACPNIQKIAAELTEVEPFVELGFKGEEPRTFQLFREHSPHVSCPVAVGILKTLEVEAGLALPREVTIRTSKSE